MVAFFRVLRYSHAEGGLTGATWKIESNTISIVSHRHCWIQGLLQYTGFGIANQTARSSYVMLFQADNKGRVKLWENVVDSAKGSPFGQPKPDPLEGLFDDAAMEDHTMQDGGKPSD